MQKLSESDVLPHTSNLLLEFEGMQAFLDIEELGLLQYGLIDWLADRKEAQWLHDIQVGRKFDDRHHVELIVRNAANLSYALRALREKLCGGDDRD